MKERFEEIFEQVQVELDLDWCYYLATNILGLSEEEFLKSTPKKLFKLSDIHLELNTPKDEKKEEVKEVYIDNIFL